MSAKISVTPQARLQALEADIWWRENRDKAPELFEQEFEAAVRLVASQPTVGRLYDESPIEGVRRVLLLRTQYHVYYNHDAGADEVVVMAVWSAIRRRGPDLR